MDRIGVPALKPPKVAVEFWLKPFNAHVVEPLPDPHPVAAAPVTLKPRKARPEALVDRPE